MDATIETGHPGGNAGVPFILISNLHKTFLNTVHALRGVDLNIEKGEHVILLGHNGSGKSTLLRCLNRLEEPTEGAIFFDGVELTNARKRTLRHARKRIGFVFQRFNLVENLSSLQNVLFGALGRRHYPQCLNLFAGECLRREAMEALDRVGLADYAEQRADQLSGGQQQRVAIARTLLQKPDVVLADEPIASLDPKAARDVMNLLWEVGREQQYTIICTLHQLDIALSVRGRIIALKEGKKVLDAPTEGIQAADLDWLYNNHPEVVEEENKL